MGRRLVLLALAAAALSLPATARAAIPLAPCGETPGLQCGVVSVPVDRSGKTPGTIALHVEVLPAPTPVRGAMFLVAGGPGQGSAKAFNLGSRNSAAFMQAMLPGYTLVAFDNRGTGASGLISCPALQTTIASTVEEEAGLALDCAEIIGPKRIFYATRDHVEDVEDVRTALGLGRVGLFGVSYGTKLSLAYAAAHPGSVERLLLDSVVPPGLPDPLDRNVLREMPAALRAFCQGTTCRGATRDFAADVVALANRLESRPIRGRVIGPGGRTVSRRMNGEDLLSLLIDADLGPGLAAELPAAVHAALGGYIRPLLRLFDLDMRTSQLDAEDLSFGLNAATNCADGRFPWFPAAPASERPSAIAGAVAASPSGSFGPFGNWSSRLGTAFFCQLWPAPAGNTPLAAGPFPNVPMLAISGGFDLRTPTANAQSIVGQFPLGHLLVVPGVGHSVLTADYSFCSQRAVRNWILIGVVRASCPRVPSLVKVVGALPRSARRSPAATVGVVATAIHEAEATFLQVEFSSKAIAPAGLYGGRLALSSGGRSCSPATQWSRAFS